MNIVGLDRHRPIVHPYDLTDTTHPSVRNKEGKREPQTLISEVNRPVAS